MAKISKIINDACEKFDIEYRSPYLDQYKEDIKTLANIYLQLKEIIGALCSIEERYSKINHFRQVLEEDIKLLLKIDHDIIRETQELREINVSRKV